MAKIIYGLRNVKFLSVAESCSEYLQQNSQFDPKIGLIVGLGHLEYLEDKKRFSLVNGERKVAVAISEVFLPTYYFLLKNAIGRAEEIDKRAILDLLNISVATVIADIKILPDQVVDFRWQGFLITEEIVEGITSALKEEQKLLASYQNSLAELRKKFSFSEEEKNLMV